MKCLEKERARRYETANGLALDVQRYLADEPVAAGPPSTRYRLRKFLRRHRHGALAAVLLLVTLLAGLGGTSWGLVQARSQRDRAVTAEEQARNQEGKARANFELARDSVEEYGSKVSNDPRLKEKDLEELRTQLLQSAIRFHQQFVEQHRDDPALRADLGRAYHDLGALAAESEDRTRALDLFGRAISVYEQLIAEHPEDSSYPLQLVATLTKQGRALDFSARPKEARTAYERALSILESARRQHGSSPLLRRRYGRTCSDLAYLLCYKVGSKEEAIAAYHKGIGFLEREPAGGDTDMEDLIVEAELYSQLGGTLAEAGQARDGLPWCNKALALLERRITKTNRPRDLLFLQALTYDNLGRVHTGLFQHQQAVEAFRKGVDINLELVAAHPGYSKYQLVLSTHYNTLAVALRQSGRTSEALAAVRKAVEVKEQLVARHPDAPDYKANLARTLINMALDSIDLKQARGYQQRAESLLKGLVDRYPDVVDYRSTLTTAYELRAQLHLRANEPRQAQEARDQATEVWKELAKLTPNDAGAQYGLGSTLMEHGRLNEAIDAFRRAVALKPD
jgi:tetratricopeptide (TPR) repeat protein